jgi:signal transduction histidine kinase
MLGSLEQPSSAGEGLPPLRYLGALRWARTPGARTALVLGTLAFDAAVLVPAGRASGNDFRGVPGVLALAAGCVLAALCGPLAGAIVSLAASLAFVAIVSDWAFGSWLAPPLWTALAITTGVLTNRVIAEQAERDRLVARLVESERRAVATRIAAGIAHHLNNKLTTIMGNAELARRGVADNERVVKALTELERASEQLAVLSHAFLIISGGRPHNTTTIDASAGLRAIEHGLAAAVAPHPLDLDIANARCPVRITREEFNELVTNLVRNAAEASPATASVRVAIRAVGADVVLEVTDSGVGMDPDRHRRAFEPFYSTKPPAVTAGLGLPVAQAIVENASGRLAVASQPGEGTTVTAYLPLATSSHPQRALSGRSE